jgi:hypothetical protein
MPAASAYWSMLEQNAISELSQAADDERKARAQIHSGNWAYYDGDHRKPLKVKNNVDNNVILNLAAQAVDRTVAFLFPDKPEIELDDNGAAENEDEKYLDACWDAASGAVLLTNTALNGALDGHVFLRVVEADRVGELPRVILLNAAKVIVYWDADDLDCVLWYEIIQTRKGVQWRQDIVNLAEITDGAEQGWRIFEYVYKQSKWQLDGEPIDWTYELGPLVDFQHLPRPNRYYGEHELKHARLNDAVNKVASDVKAILRSHASPKTIGTGVQPAAVQETAIDSFWAIPNEAAKVFNLEMNSDLASSMTYMQFLADTFMAQSRVAMLRGGPDQYKNITNLGIKAAFMDMIAKNEILRRQYGQGIIEVCRRLLMLGGRAYDVQPTLRWASALPVSALEDVQVAQAEINMGVISKETVAGKLGLKWDDEAKRIDAEGGGLTDALDRLMQHPNGFDTPMDRVRQQQQIGAGGVTGDGGNGD